MAMKKSEEVHAAVKDALLRFPDYSDLETYIVKHPVKRMTLHFVVLERSFEVETYILARRRFGRVETIRFPKINNKQFVKRYDHQTAASVLYYIIREFLDK